MRDLCLVRPRGCHKRTGLVESDNCTVICQPPGPLRETTDAYLLKVRAAGGFRTYERTHLNAIAATFIPKLPLLPPEMVRRVVEYAFHVGDY